MPSEFFMTLIGPMAVRLLISQQWEVNPYKALVYNSLDMSVSAFAYLLLKEKNKKIPHQPHRRKFAFLLIARVSGILTGVSVLKLNPWGTIEVPVAVFLNFASLCANFALTYFIYPPHTRSSEKDQTPKTQTWAATLLRTYF